jgi:hypothetical protein
MSPVILLGMWKATYNKGLVEEGKVAWAIEVKGKALSGGIVPDMDAEPWAYGNWIIDYTIVMTILENALGDSMYIVMSHPRYLALSSLAPIIQRIRVITGIIHELSAQESMVSPVCCLSWYAHANSVDRSNSVPQGPGHDPRHLA